MIRKAKYTKKSGACKEKKVFTNKRSVDILYLENIDEQSRGKGMVMNTNIQQEALTAVIVGICLIIGAGIVLCRRFRKRYADRELDEMEGFDFEYYCADLLKEHGFYDVEVTRSSGDYGIDILAEKEGVTYAIQCKRYSGPVGVKAVQEAYAGRDYYDRMVGCVMTNQYFTQPAVEAAKKLKILLWDRGYLESMLEEE